MFEDRLAQVFAEAGCQGSVAVLDIDGPGQVVLGGDELVVAASTFKIAVALELFCRGAEGELDLAERVRLAPSQATPGGQGFCIFEDEAEVSLRDLARMMVTISDNTATDVLIRRVSVPRIHARLAALGLDRIRLAGTIQEEFDAIGRDTGFAGWAEMTRAMREAGSPRDAERIWERALSAPSLRPGRITSATAGQMAALLRMIWRDEAGPAEACAAVRSVLGQQRLTRKIAAGFGDEVRVAAKSGTVPGCVSNDAGVVHFPDGSRFAVAVFTRPTGPGPRPPQSDSVMGTVARLGVEHLRRLGR
ncbi:serine hydrolase [Streptomyces sp. Ag109_G2-15]|uniref:serine hydrolase n=1 Tax=Streptomyces sp. Ag109_G2-15 TaxID=1938850 RepID=UPI000BCC442B|nr:serine hydrolase [Streptomyces sp. Ag109_G2-15]SOE06833.1 beta-lactamase class A [Streptomyces sp. Ag109_G2-15]